MAEISELLSAAIPPNAWKILRAAEDNGWTENGATTLVVRLHKPDDTQDPKSKGVARPFFLRWDLAGKTKLGKPSWAFQGARANNGQGMTLEDALLYLEDPSVIYPEPPEEQDG